LAPVVNCRLDATRDLTVQARTLLGLGGVMSQILGLFVGERGHHRHHRH
jgi:hypothetical protein